MTEHDLRTLLEDAVADVEPRHALADIQARTAATRPRRPWVWGTVAAVAATAATVAAVTVVTDRSPQQSTDAPPAASQSPDATPTMGVDVPTDGPTEEPPATPAAGGLLPVYFVGHTPTGPRLYREFSTSDEIGTFPRMLEAVTRAVSGEAADPDYSSGWPTGTKVDGVGTTANAPDPTKTLTVGLSGSANLSQLPAGMTQDEALLTVQQIVYTMQAVRQQRLAVEFDDAQGNPYRTLLGVDVSQPVTNQPEASVQAPVWVIDPQDGATVGTTFEVNGRGAFFEATVSWQLLQGSQVVKDGFTTADEGMTLSPYSFTVRDVPPGAYTLRVYDADVSGGEGNGEQEDTKRITVR